MSESTGILRQKSPRGDVFFYPVAHDVWSPMKNTYVCVNPARDTTHIVELSEHDIATGGFEPVGFYGDNHTNIWLSEDKMLKHLRQIALTLARAQATV